MSDRRNDSLEQAVEDGDLETVKQLLRPEDLNRADFGMHQTLLYLAAEENHLDIVYYLIKQGADIDCDVFGGTPLTAAAKGGHLAIVKYLLESGARMDTSDPISNPLRKAIWKGHDDVAKYLIEQGMDVHATYRVPSGELENALTDAEEEGRHEIVKLLKEKGCRHPIEGVDKPLYEPAAEEMVDQTKLRRYQSVVRYMAEQFGPVDRLGQNELLPSFDDMSVTINFIRPNDEHPYFVIFTNGMSDRAMTVPSGSDEWQYAELVMQLPPDWIHPREAGGDSQWLWPVQWLRKAAYMPHLNDTWLAPPGTIISSADPPEPLGPNTRQTCLLLVPRFANLNVPLKTEDGRVINFWTVVPLYTAERDYELQHGMRAFFERFMKHKVPMTVDIHRPSFVD